MAKGGAAGVGRVGGQAQTVRLAGRGGRGGPGVEAQLHQGGGADLAQAFGQGLGDGGLAAQAGEGGAELVEGGGLAFAGLGGGHAGAGAAQQLADDDGHAQEDAQHDEVGRLVDGEGVVGRDEEVIEGQEGQQGGEDAEAEAAEAGGEADGQQVEQGDDGRVEPPRHEQQSEGGDGHQPSDKQELLHKALHGAEGEGHGGRDRSVPGL